MRFLLFGLLVASLVGWLLTYQRQRWRIRRLERSNEEIQVEENLVFDFLHGLGEAFRDVIRPHETRRRLCRALAMLRGKKLANPWRKHGNIPL